jgi:transposase
MWWGKAMTHSRTILGISRLRVHSDKAMKGLVMVSFITLIVRTWVHVRMDKAGLYKKYTMKELFKTVDTTSSREAALFLPLQNNRRRFTMRWSVPLRVLNVSR